MAKLVCTVELSKDTGISIKVENAAGKITQTITMDGTTLTMKVAGEQDTSTYTQTADRVAIKCKYFTLDADETITCTSGKATLHDSKDVMTLQSTKDFTVTSSAKLVQSATSDVTVDGENITATATSAATMKGNTSKVDGTQSLALSGGTQLDASGAQVKIQATTQLGVESNATATFGGLTTTIKGTLISEG